jgi:hypothetical protein
MSSLVVSYCTTVLLIMLFLTSRLELLLLCPESHITVTCFDVLTMVSSLLNLRSTTVLLIMLFLTSRLELLLLCPESQITVTCFDVLTMVSKLFLPFDHHSQQRWARQRKEEKNVIRVYTSVTSHVSEIRQCSKATSLRTLVEDRSLKIEIRTPNSNLCTVIVLLAHSWLFGDRISITK